MAILLSFCTSALNAGIITLTGTSYTQNFNGLLTTGSTAVTGGDLNNLSTSLNGWFFLESGSNANTTITAGTGSVATGDTYSFGPTAGADRALGGLQSGTVIPSWGFIFTNGTGQTITDIAISYLGETWRVGTVNRSDRIDFQTLAGATALGSGTWVDNNALDYANPGQAATGSGSVQHSATITSTISSLSIANGTNYGFKWTDFNATGADDGIGIDDFSITFTLAAGTTDLFWLGGDTTRGGAGTWENSGGTAWSSTDADGAGTAWDSTKAAIFNTSPATVTLSGIVDVNKGITFATGTDGSTISGGTALNLGGATAADNTISTASAVTATITSTITGTANGLTKSGDGALILGSSNSFVGTVNVSAGTLSISSDDQLGDTANDIVLGGILKTTTSIAMNAGRDLSGTGTLDIAPSTTLTVNGNISTSSLTLSNTGTASLAGTNSVGALSITGNTTVQGTAISLTGLTSTHTGTASVSNNLTFTSGDKTVSVPAGATLSLTGTVTAPGRILKIGTGTLELASDNTTLGAGARLGASSGSPTDGGILKIGHKNSLGAPTSTFQFNYGTLNATTTLTGANAIPNPLSIGGRTGAAAVISGSDIEFTGDFGFFRGTGSATGQMVVNVNNTTTLNGNVIAIAGVGGAATGLTLGGTGKLVLGGNWSLNDLPITVADSLTLVTNTTVTSALNVGPTSTLGGNGTISGPTTIEGTHNPGNSPGIQIFGSDLTYSGGASVVNWELIGNTTSGRGTNFDGIDVGGTLNFAGATTLNLSFGTPLGVLWSNLLWATNQSWLLYDVTSPVSNFSNLGINPTNWQDSSGALFNTALAGSTFTLSQTDNDIYLNYTVIPEPSRALLLGLGSIGLIFRRRRQ